MSEEQKTTGHEFGVGIGTLVLLGFSMAFPLMLALDVLHGRWPQVPAFGYLQCVPLWMAARAAFATILRSEAVK